MNGIPAIVPTALLLAASNVFMTFAWYGHLKSLNTKPWYIAAFVSWGIALFEYLLQVPANRIGYTQLTLPQLKMLQGSDHAHRLRAVCGLLYAKAPEAGLPLGGAVHAGRHLLRVQVAEQLMRDAGS